MLATAGMRMIPQEAQDAILNKLRTSVPSMTSFVFAEQNVGVITGKEEGIYAWIAANYVLGKLKFTKFGNKIPSTGIIDMGGGSMQIAFEVPKDANIEKHDNIAHVSLGSTGLDYDLFVTTHLGFGANEALRRHIETLPASDESTSDPCFPANFVGDVHDRSISGTGDYQSCYSSLKPLLEKSSCPADDETCSLAGSYQPSLSSVGEFFGFSEFYYTTSEYCATEWEKLEENWKEGMYKADANRLKNQCFKSAWVSLVLHEGLNFPEEGKKLTNVQTIDGAEVQWALGALIYRTRYLPLRNAQPIGASTPSSHFVESKSNGVFFFCIGLIILLSIAQYRRIHSSSRSPYTRLPLSRPDSRVI
ncbi:Oidioi.mRNA.OKI2018_I69.chr1.g2197.t1.cds [Oikopleura dioica]|uniref:Oidioi.mRNA.OKI2018_I69.chr1.g2197.t1.cds n=1 Tax=Oikopleura dioica TaxID=34765 RepID=A0ABN7SVH7_OIKDI|nr:Oidioi.mRNA.OKI2018_I69.chr1.g2197.t1.cds [Oikopleura dioica]